MTLSRAFVFTLFVALSLGCVSGSAGAQSGPLLWHSENLQLLRGDNYKVGDEGRSIVTFEHASRWSWGDVFLFTDFTAQDNGERNLYGELIPRLSLSALSGREVSGDGLIRDVLLVGNYEFGDQGLERYLAGLGVDFNVDGFRFLRVSGLHRDDPTRAGSTWQVTIAWNRPFEIGGQSFLAEGFADIAGAEGPGVENQLAVPRLLWNTHWIESDNGQLFLGVEYQYWHNKFGIDGITENVAQLQLKWVWP